MYKALIVVLLIAFAYMGGHQTGYSSGYAKGHEDGSAEKQLVVDKLTRIINTEREVIKAKVAVLEQTTSDATVKVVKELAIKTEVREKIVDHYVVAESCILDPAFIEAVNQIIDTQRNDNDQTNANLTSDWVCLSSSAGSDIDSSSRNSNNPASAFAEVREPTETGNEGQELERPVAVDRSSDKPE